MRALEGSEVLRRGCKTMQAYPSRPLSIVPTTALKEGRGRCSDSLPAMADRVLVDEIRECRCGLGDSVLSKVTPRTSSLSEGLTWQQPTLMGGGEGGGGGGGGGGGPQHLGLPLIDGQVVVAGVVHNGSGEQLQRLADFIPTCPSSPTKGVVRVGGALLH